MAEFLMKPKIDFAFVEGYRRELELEARAAAESGAFGNGRKNA